MGLAVEAIPMIMNELMQRFILNLRLIDQKL